MKYFVKKRKASILDQSNSFKVIRPIKAVFFPEMGQVKSFYNLPARVVKCVSEFIFFNLKKKKKTSQKNTKKKKKLIKRR